MVTKAALYPQLFLRWSHRDIEPRPPALEPALSHRYVIFTLTHSLRQTTLMILCIMGYRVSAKMGWFSSTEASEMGAITIFSAVFRTFQGWGFRLFSKSGWCTKPQHCKEMAEGGWLWSVHAKTRFPNLNDKPVSNWAKRMVRCVRL